jgi:hypothetical protein
VEFGGAFWVEVVVCDVGTDAGDAIVVGCSEDDSKQNLKFVSYFDGLD